MSVSTGIERQLDLAVDLVEAVLDDLSRSTGASRAMKSARLGRAKCRLSKAFGDLATRVDVEIRPGREIERIIRPRRIEQVCGDHRRRPLTDSGSMPSVVRTRQISLVIVGGFFEKAVCQNVARAAATAASLSAVEILEVDIIRLAVAEADRDAERRSFVDSSSTFRSSSRR